MYSVPLFFLHAVTVHHQDNPLLLMKAERETLLAAVMLLEGRGACADGRCELCRQEAMYRCLDCAGVNLLCARCLCRIHCFHPYHIIEVSLSALRISFAWFSLVNPQKWNGSYFEKSSLREAGHIFQIGHHPADQCTNPQPSTKAFTIVHVNGIHLINLAYCGCSEAGNHGTRVEQLTRRRLFPAMTLDPQTACTFLLLKAVQLLSLQSKLSLYDYYIHLEQLTDATGTTDVNVSQLSGYFKKS